MSGPIGYQTWRDLTFVHWRVPASRLTPLLPAGLTVDTFDGDAWVGLVPFAMERVRPWWGPAVPGISWFLETNVRTYVRLGGRDPGVWFFSLDADARVAVAIARLRWALNYRLAGMRLERDGPRLRYRGARRADPAHASDVTVRLPAPEPSPARAEPGTLEHFLVERYLLYTVGRGGTLLRGRVEHAPYPLVPGVELERCDETLCRANGIELDGPPAHVAFSRGVDVSIHPLRPLADEGR